MERPALNHVRQYYINVKTYRWANQNVTEDQEKMAQLMVLLLYLIPFVKLQNVDFDFYPPLWPKFKSHFYGLAQIDRLPILHDEDSGCSCRVYSNTWTDCFGNDSCHTVPNIIVNTTNFHKIHSTSIEVLRKHEFSGYSNIISLNIEWNYLLSAIKPGAFTNMSAATNVSISYNKNLTRLQKYSFYGLVNVKEMILIKNGFHKVIDATIALSSKTLPNIFKVSLSENVFKNITEADFTPMKDSSIRELNLVLCQIEHMHPKTILPLTNLSSLRLGENLFNATTITNLITTSTKFGIPLHMINLYGNGFRKTPPKEILMAISRSTVTQLQLLDLREVLMTDILSDALKDMPALRTLLLSGNKLNYVPDGLRVLGLKNSSINCIEDGTFLQLPNLLVLNLENNYFKLNNNVFNGLENLQVLLLGGSSISYIPTNNNPFQNLTRLAHLGLENNALLTLSSEELRPLSNLITIDVSRNRLTSWDKRVFIYNSKISVMLISNNKLSHFSKSMLDDFTNLSRFDISGNPFVCDCKSFRTLYEWFEINGNATILNLFNGNPTYCVYPEKVADENLMNVYELFQSGSRRCESIDMNEYFLTAVSLALLVLILLSTIAVSYCFRWHIRYWIFLARVNLSQLGICTSNGKKRSYTNYQYDAFISYCKDDKNFVVRLVSMLENFEPYFKLCVYERDFQVGSVICESVMTSIEKSRKTILIISDAYDVRMVPLGSANRQPP
ncbi:hypothetical protein FQA39_LY19165 [Lamprigera yunnana]|nr:hypothetical protein FQA39_LY19165 [Lamprigera yunnana]